MCQEVITNEAGRKIVLDANGNWQYFQEDSTGSSADAAKFKLSKRNAAENERRIAESMEVERALTLLLIKKRVEKIDLNIQMQANSANKDPRLKEQFDGLEQKIRQLELQLETARKRTAFLQKIANLPPQPYNRKLKRWEADHPFEEELAGLTTNKMATTKGITTNNIAHGILLLPPELPCGEGMYGTDQSTQSIRWETAPSVLFIHTDRVVAQEFRKRDFLECAGNLIASKGGAKRLNIAIAVATANAPQLFGKLLRGDFLELRLLNGERVKLYNTLPNSGEWVAAQGAYIYHGSYILGIREEKMLRNSDLDKVLVRWGLLQEEYEVFETDFFVRHFHCLDAMQPK